MKYEFELTMHDYMDMTMASLNSKEVVRSYVPHVLSGALITWIVAKHTFGASMLVASMIGLAVFAAGLVHHSMNWRRNYLNALSRHYDAPEQRAILGAHTLELTDDGINSSGPLHRTFRKWAAVTHASLTLSHCLFYTSFGVVYVLPLRAVEDREGLVTRIRDKHGVQLQEA